jgi:hypothetical protein
MRQEATDAGVPRDGPQLREFLADAHARARAACGSLPRLVDAAVERALADEDPRPARLLGLALLPLAAGERMQADAKERVLDALERAFRDPDGRPLDDA